MDYEYDLKGKIKEITENINGIFKDFVQMHFLTIKLFTSYYTFWKDKFTIHFRFVFQVMNVKQNEIGKFFIPHVKILAKCRNWKTKIWRKLFSRLSCAIFKAPRKVQLQTLICDLPWMQPSNHLPYHLLTFVYIIGTANSKYITRKIIFSAFPGARWWKLALSHSFPGPSSRLNTPTFPSETLFCIEPQKMFAIIAIKFLIIDLCV